MNRSIVLLDMDGTLTDTQSALLDAVSEIASHDFGADQDEFRSSLVELLRGHAHELWEGIWQAMGRDPAGVTDEEQGLFKTKASAALAGQTKLFPEVRGVLARLKAMGYTLVLSTNTPADVVEQRTDRAGIREYFTLLLGVDHGPNNPTKADHPAMAGSHLSMSPEAFAAAAVYVGDTEGDMRLAVAAGLPAIGRQTDENADLLRAEGALHVINTLDELEPLLQSLS